MENVNIFSVISAIVSLGSLIGIYAVWYKARAEVKREEASTAETYEAISERTAKRLELEITKNTQLEEKVDQLIKEVRTLRQEVRELESGVGILVRQLEENHITPAWIPNRKGATI